MSFYLGVDPKSDPCTDIKSLNLKIFLDSEPVEIDKLVLLIDEPHLKRFEIPIGKGKRGERFTIRLEYCWQGGFRPLLENNIDSGDFNFTSKGVEWCRICFELEDRRHQFTNFNVYYVDPSRISRGSSGNPRQRSFIINRPEAGKRIGWAVAIGTAPPIDNYTD